MIVNAAGGVVRNLMQGVQPSWSRGGGTGAPVPAAPAPVKVQPQPQPQAPPPAVPSGPSGYIAFPVFREGAPRPTYDIYVARPDGSERRLLWEWGRQPDIRPDGRVVVNGDGNGKDSLWTVNLDGSEPQEVSTHTEDAHACWSPEGGRLVFDSQFYTWADQRIWTIWIQHELSSGIEPFPVNVASRVVPGEQPVWLDNDWIVYKGCNFWEGGSKCGLYTNPAGGGASARQLTDSADDLPKDSFGERIVYMSLADGNWEVYAINFDGSGKVNLTNNPTTDGLPTFSPDGSQIAFVSDRDGAWAVWAMNSDGSNPLRLFDLGGIMGGDWPGERISWGLAGPEPVAPAPAQPAPQPQPQVPAPAPVQTIPEPQPQAPAPVQAVPQPQPQAPAPAPVQPAPQAAAGGGLPGYIAFPVYKTGMSKPTYDIYVSRPDGSDRRLLWEWGRQPDIRRGDGRVVLNGDGQGRDNLWTVNLDGSDAKESSLHPEDSHPRWSPNGDRLLFDSEFYVWNDQRMWTVWLQNSAGKGTEPISVNVADRVVPGQNPIWLDNDWVIYSGCNFWEGGSRCGLFTAPSWGEARARQLTDQPDDRAGDFYGDRIAYMSRASGNWDVYTVNFDGGGKVNLTNHPANDGLPTFSPDGSRMAFLSDREGVWAIWVMSADGSNPQKLFDIGGTMGEDWTTERISWGP